MSAGAGSPTVPKSGGLLRILGLGFSLAVMIGGTVGIGILRTPGEVAALLRTPGLILGIWVLGGVYVLLGSLSVAELGTMLPKAGGFYVYARRAFGDDVGLLIGLTDWLGQSSAIAYAAVALGEFVGFLVPELRGRRNAIALGFLLGFGLLHWRGLRASSNAQNWMTVVKALIFSALIVSCLRTPATQSLQPLLAPRGNALVSAWFLALAAVIVTYDGWYAAIYFTEEGLDPARDLPRAMFGAAVVVIVLYLLVNLCFLRVLGTSGLAASKQPAADAAVQIAGAAAGRLVTVISILSVLPMMNALLMCSSRVFFGLSRDRLVPGALNRVNAHGTPVALLPTLLAAGLLAATGTFSHLIGIAAFLFVVNHCASFLAVLVLRRREPDAVRPFKAPLYPVVPLAALGGGLSYLGGALIADRANAATALAIVLAGYPALRIARRLLGRGSS